MEYIQIQDHPTLVRDPNSKAILSIDNHKLSAYEQQKRQMDAAKESIEEIALLKQEVNELKQLLIQLINIHNDQSINNQ